MRIAWLYNDVAFGRHRAPLKWSDLEGHEAGLTGSDLVVVNYAREFVVRGHEVVLYCHNAEPTSYDGVEVRPYSEWEKESEPTDVAITLSNPNPLRHAGDGTLRVVNRQVSAFGIDCFEYETRGFDSFVDLYTCPSDHARHLVSAGMPHPEKFQTQPNGVYPGSLHGYEKVPGRVIYCSSPDRGLHLLLSVWPEIRRRVPGATLLVAYQSLRQWLTFHTDPAKRFSGHLDHECTRRAFYVREGLRRLSAHGVEVHDGGMSHLAIGEELKKAEVLAFPCDVLAHTETFSVATLEAAAYGAVPVISNADCLGEVHGSASVVVKDVRENLPQFVDHVVALLTRPDLAAEMRKVGREHARAHAWPVLAEKYEAMLLEAIERKKRGLLVVGSKMKDSANPGSPRVESAERKVRIDLVLTKYASGEEQIDASRPFDSNSGGGCRAGFMGLVRELPKLGYKVRAFANVTDGRDHGKSKLLLFNKDDVDYIPLENFRQDGERDVLLAYYDTSPLVGVSGCLRVASHHTFQLPAPGACEWTDVNLAPSAYAVDALRLVYDDTAPWYVMPNGLPLETLPGWNPVPGRCIYHTSPSRGLANLLEGWPEIRRRVPGASLHVVGGVTTWLQHYEGKKCRQAKIAERVSRALDAIVSKGRSVSDSVAFLGKLPRAGVLRELSEASCFPFPFEAPMPCETFSVSVAECLAIGVPVVLRPGDAMEELWGQSTHRIEESGHVVEATVQVLTDRSHARYLSGVGRAAVERYTFGNKARALDLAIRENLPGAVVKRDTPFRNIFTDRGAQVEFYSKIYGSNPGS